MTNEEILDRIEVEINNSMYSQIWDQNLGELIDKIREELKEEANQHFAD